MVANTEKKTPIKMAGYLEKRGKMRMVCRWKRMWFVLKGRLLHYYKSQVEYDNLSPCRGSLNMGIAANVLPGKGLELQVFTRSQSIVLRAANKLEHEQWLQALLDAMTLQDHHISPSGTVKPVQHFRYPSNTDMFKDVRKHKGSKSLDHLAKFSLKGRYDNPDEDIENSENIMADDSISLLSKSTSGTSKSTECSSKDQTTSIDNCSQCRLQIIRSTSSINRSNTISTTTSNYKTNENTIINKKLLQRFSSVNSKKIMSSDTAIPNSLKSRTLYDMIDISNNIDEDDKCQSLKELRSLTSADKAKQITTDKKELLMDNTTNKKVGIIDRSESLKCLKFHKKSFSSSLDRKLYLQDMKVLVEGRSVYGSSDSVFNKTSIHSLPKINCNNICKIIKENDKTLCNKIKPNNCSFEKNQIVCYDSLYENKEVRSDTDLSLLISKKDLNSTVTVTGSCGELTRFNSTNTDKLRFNLTSTQLTKPNHSISVTSSSLTSLSTTNKELLNSNEKSNPNLKLSFNSKTKLSNSNSLLKKLIIKNDGFNNNNCSNCNSDCSCVHEDKRVILERKGTLKKRSLSFLRRMWKWRETSVIDVNNREDKFGSNNGSITALPGDTLTSNKSKEKGENLKAELSDTDQPEEPVPDYDGSISEDETVPALPPRKIQKQIVRPESPCHDIPSNNQPVSAPSMNSNIDNNDDKENDDKPPPLPKKTRRSLRSTTSTSSELSMNLCTHQFINYDLAENIFDPTLTANNISNDNIKNNEGGEIQDKFNNFKTFPQPELVNIDVNDNSLNESIYDVPRLHATLRASLRKNSLGDKLVPTRFLNGNGPCVSQYKASNGSIEFDSLDENATLWRTGTPYDSVMTPDSLECESLWPPFDDPSWNHNHNQRTSITSDSLPRHFISIEEKIYEDSLNDN